MTQQSNNQGRAYEYICLMTLNEEINTVRPSQIICNSAYFAAEHAWTNIPSKLRDVMKQSSLVAVATIFELEPMILESNDDPVILKIQTDEAGQKGDVRDIIISRTDVKWEIGLSIKHNHFAVKHSRLSKNLDFGARWFGMPCSQKYWEETQPIFDFLEEQKKLGKKWNELTNKAQRVYLPLLRAFLGEINICNKRDKTIPSRMVEYLLGEFDFYKVISIDSRKITQIQTYNLHGQLNQSSQTKHAEIQIPIASLPTRIVSFDFKPNSTNTVELYMDGGWQFSFRIHNASTYVESSLKFDIQIIGMPTTIILINCQWN